MLVVSMRTSMVGMLGLVLAFLLLSSGTWAEAMTFRLVPLGIPAKCRSRCIDAIAANGEITNSTPDKFIAFLRRTSRNRRVRSVVLLNSPGGHVVASMQLGMVLRKVRALGIVARAKRRGRGRRTVLTSGHCYSACVYALMGAAKRVVPHGSKVGIHRMFAYEWERDRRSDRLERLRVYGSQDLETRLANYAASMGVSRELITTAERISPDSIHILTRREIRRWRLASLKF